MSSSSNSSDDSSSDSPPPLNQQNSGSIPMFSPYVSYTTSNALKIKSPPQQSISTSITNPPTNPYTSNQCINISNPQVIEIKPKNQGFIMDSSKTPINGPVFPPKLASHIPIPLSTEPIKPLQIPINRPFPGPLGMPSEGIKDPLKIPSQISPDKLGQQIKPPQIPSAQPDFTKFPREKTENVEKSPMNFEKDIKKSFDENMKPPSLLQPLPFKTNSNAVIDKNGPLPPNLAPKILPPPRPSQPPPLNPSGIILGNPWQLGTNPPPSLLPKTNNNNDKLFFQPVPQPSNNLPPSLLTFKNETPILNPIIPSSQPCLISRVPAFPIEKIPVAMTQELKTQANDYKNPPGQEKNLQPPPIKKESLKPPPLIIKSLNSSLQLDPDKVNKISEKPQTANKISQNFQSDNEISQNPQSDSKMHNPYMPKPKTDIQNLTPNNQKPPYQMGEIFFSNNNSLDLLPENQKAPDFESNSSISQNNSDVLVIGRDINSLTLQCLDIKVCFLCKSNKNIIDLKCEHFLCENCLQKTVENAAEKHFFYSEKLKIPPLCPCCGRKIHQELFVNFSYYKNIIAKGIERYRNAIFGIKTCFSCKKAYTLTRFFKKPKCQHQCKECVATEINLAKEKCPFCPEKYDSVDLMNARERCSCCMEEKSYVKDCVFSICNEHYHCLRCLQIALCSRKCRKCDRNVSKDDYFRVFQRLKRFREQFN